MRLAIPAAIAALALSAVVTAQDSTVKSRTNIKADDARVMSMTGCLRQELSTGVYALDGAIAASGKQIETNSKVKTDVDKDKTTVKGRAEAKADGGVGTAGSTSTFLLVPGNNVDLASHVGERVQISAITVNPGHGDADVKIRDKTKIDPEHAPDTKAQSKTKLELPRSSAGQYTVMSVTPLGTRCGQ
jgi:hypothetical protein